MDKHRGERRRHRNAYRTLSVLDGRPTSHARRQILRTEAGRERITVGSASPCFDIQICDHLSTSRGILRPERQLGDPTQPFLIANETRGKACQVRIFRCLLYLLQKSSAGAPLIPQLPRIVTLLISICGDPKIDSSKNISQKKQLEEMT
ncbi:hypothetical protein PAAG_07026 [Paracoccidioides lutzii Pb01]|uniref:Uncharacterized protein n=1 Tax=Paracoccidioides lutzii (strain ATCC MYA-826 / Pb01) TaxID=502779 RepID=C1H849_PARBA|nr:hypothetical protein PAAG_07026 [Paracoccidioides lutzii Pb01]EEH36608.2 hypothetical protein PAAG_07026 [Paracoccidioides lutzii Pb01]